MQPHAGKHLKNSGNAKPGSGGALGLRSLLFEPLGLFVKRLMCGSTGCGEKRAAQRKLGKAEVDCASSPLHLDNLW